MGDVISLAQRRGAGGPGHAAVEFFFDLASPWTYFAAERLDTQVAGATWRPVLADVLRPVGPRAEAADRAAAGARAAALRMPLVWPEAPEEDAADAVVPLVPRFRAAMRVAHLAAEQGRAAAFVLAAGRLAFCGGFDLDDPEILAEAAAAAGLPFDACLQAMGDRGRDDAMAATGDALVAAGATALPCFRVGGALFSGEVALAAAVAAHRARPESRLRAQ